MNKQSYRIVFNKARSLLMAVSETASAQGKASGQTQGQDPIAQENSMLGARFSMAYELSQQSWLPRPVARALSAVLIFSLQFSAILPSLMSQRAYAAGPSATTITADPNAAGNLRPTVLTTSSGLAQVNIQTPNAAGVSVNHYSQFDVGSNGAILNNSRTNAQTQTGGWVTGNPWLAGGSAQTILNQVNSTNPSQLNGYVEVAGQRANVILANPNGISVNGGGFINAARTTLTTGTPNFDTTGAISGYSVRQGAVSVDGLGLDTSTADFTDIISRSVSLNAGVWANKLKITTGVNDVDANNTHAVPVAGAGTGAAPSFALDSSALGGMYAGAITLQGTESGVGVRNAGQIGASAGQVQISADGLLTNSGKITASADLLVNTTATGGGGVANSGTLYAGGATQITTQGSVANTGAGLIAAQGNTSITASGAASQLTNDKNATIAAGLNPDGTLGSTGNLNLSATLGMSGNGQMIAGGAYAATGQSLNVAGANINAASVNLTATAGNLNATGASLTGRDSLTASTTQTLQTDGAVLQSNQLNLSAQAISNVGGQLLQTGTADMNIAVPGSIDNTGGTISANAQNLHLSAASINNTSGKLQHVGSGTFSVNANQALNNTQGQIASNQNLILNAAELNNSQGAVQTGGNAALTLGTLRNESGIVTTGQDLQINASSVSNSGTLYAAGQQQLNVTGGLTNTGTIAAQKNTTITAQTINSAPVQGSGGLLGAGIKTDGTLATSGDLSVTTRGTSTSGAPALSATGQNLAGGQLTLQGDAINIAASQTQAQNILLNASAGDVNAAGATLSAATGNLNVQAGGATQTLVTDNAHLLANQLNINVGKFSNRAGEIVQSGSADSTLVAQSLDNTAGRMASAATNWTFQTTNFNNTNGGRIEHAADSAAPSSLTLTAQNANNAGGAVLSNGALNFQAGSLNNDTGTISAQQISLATSSGALSNRAGQIVQSGSAATTVNVAGALDNSGGVIASNGHTTLNAQSLSNQAGSVQAAGTTSVPANLTVILTGLLDNSAKGNLQATGDSLVQAASVNNNAGSITAGGKMNIAAQAALTNAAGTLASVGSAQVSAGTLDNSHGTIASVKDKLSITSFAAANNSGGQIEAAGDVQFTSTALNNAQGTVIGQNVQLNTQGGALTNTQGGLIAARSALSVNSGALDNTGGTIQSAGGMSLNTHAQSLTNAASANASNPGGVIYSGAELNITSGALSNSAGGAILSGGDTSITASNLVNSATIGSQGKLSISAPLVNTGGQLLAQTDLSINSGAAVLDNSGGLIRANGSATLNAATLLNTNTQGLAADGSANQGIEGNSVSITANTLQNQSGSLRGGDLLSIISGGTVNNSQGQISAAGTASITDANTAARTLALTNTDGNIIAGKQLNILAASASGDGKLQSTGDLSIDLSSDFVNTGKIIANHNASFSTSGNLVNSGTFNAGNTLSVQANNIDNQASGQISAATTNVIAQNTLTNRGLIDGSEVYVRANELNNTGTGRVYGDHLAIQAGTLNNSAENGVAAVIAARSRLDLGVGTVNNTDHALIFSGGDMVIGATLDDAHHATGQAQAINNASATIQAMGHGLINAAKINNTNAHFATEMQSTGSTAQKIEFEVDGKAYALADVRYLDPAHNEQPFVVDDNGYTTLVLPSTKYPFDQWPTKPTVGQHINTQILTSRQSTPTTGNADSGFTFGTEYDIYTNASDPIWAKFGVQPPSTPYPAPLKPLVAVTSYCGENECSSLVDPNTTEEKAAYAAAIAPWHKAMDLLDTQISDYNQDIYSRTKSEWNVRIYNSTTQQLVVTQSDPSKILIGGNLALISDSVINDKSQIVVGGTLVPGSAVVQNLGATGTKIEEISGNQIKQTTYTRGWTDSVGRDDGAIPYTPAPFTTTFNLAIGTVDNAVSASTAPTIQSVNILAVTDKAYVDQRVFKLLQPLSQSANVTATVAAVSSAAATLPTAANPIRTVSLVEKTGAKPGAVQLVVRTSLVNPTLPNNALYHINAGNSTQPLIETDPRFANYKDWLGSDYMMKALGLDPSAIGKRLGDGFYEQQMLTQQIIQLTGYRYLAGYSNDETEYRALMDAGVTYAKRYNLSPGVALTEAQMAQLTSDIVWLVSKTVTLADGTRQTVLVPQVYARVKAGDIDGSGTLMSGDTVAGTLTGDLVNGGTIAGRTAVNLAANNLANTGLITGEDIGLRAANDLSNIGGQITAGRSADIAAGHNLTIASTTQTSSSSQGTRVNLDRIAGIYVGGASSVDANGNTITPRLNLSAGNLLSVSGANVGTSPNGKVTLQAADIALGTVTTSSSQNSVWDENNYSKYSSSTEVGSTISGGSVAISASNDLALRATTINAAPTGQVSLSAGHSVTIEAGSSSSNYDGKSQSGSNGLFSFQDKAQTSIQDQGIVRSTVNGGSVVISSGQGTGVGDITLSGLTVNAKALTLNAADGNGALNLNVAQTQHDESRTSASNSALWQSQAGQGSSNTDAQYNQFNLGANQPVITNKGAGTALAGTAGAGTAGATSTKSDTTVAMLSPKAGVGGASTALGDSTALTATSNTGVAGLTINAAKVNVQVGVTTRKTTDGEDSTFTKGTLQSSIQQLASQPGTAYIATLQSQLQSNPAFKNPDGTSKVNWQQIDQAHQNWNYESQGLTAAGAAVVALIVAACTAGAGIAALGPMAAGAMGFTTTVVEGVLVTSTAASMVSAAVVAGAGSLITQASISLINNQGDLGKTFQDLGSSQSLKQLATAMVTAGALQGLGSVPLGESGFTLNSISTASGSSFVAVAGKNLVNNVTSSLINHAIQGGNSGDLEKSLTTSFASALIEAAVAQGAYAIGQNGPQSNQQNLNSAGAFIAHAVVGCIGGAAKGAVAGGNAGSSCGAGALGASVAELAAPLIDPNQTGGADTVRLAGIISATAVALTGADAARINIAAAAGSNAVENNYLAVKTLAGAVKACVSAPNSVNCLRKIGDTYQAQSSANNDAITLACINTGGSDGCKAAQKTTANDITDLQVYANSLSTSLKKYPGDETIGAMLKATNAQIGQAQYQLAQSFSLDKGGNLSLQTMSMEERINFGLALGVIADGTVLARKEIDKVLSWLKSPPSVELPLGAKGSLGAPDAGQTGKLTAGSGGSGPIIGDLDANGNVILRNPILPAPSASPQAPSATTPLLTKGANGGLASLVETQATLTAQVADLRATLTGNAKMGGNMGVAQIDIPGIQPTMAASSQVDVPSAAQVASGFVGKVPETFPSSVVLTGGVNPFPLFRDVDSEAKILNNVAAQLGDNTAARGTINLLTERSPCASCSNVIDLFKAKYPNIRVNVFDNNGKLISPTKKGS